MNKIKIKNIIMVSMLALQFAFCICVAIFSLNIWLIWFSSVSMLVMGVGLPILVFYVDNYFENRNKKAPTKETFFDRLKIEANELSFRLKKLEAFLYSEKFNELDSNMKNLLIDQKKTMDIYLEILIRRIDLIEIKSIFN